MKALVVADNPLVIDNTSQVLESAGYDVIVYKWLLKALDNVEEIAPHLIIISTKDYPRHWKTLTQFSTTNFGGYKPQVVLYAEDGLSEDERQKAKALDVRGIFESVDVEGLDALRKILLKDEDIYSGNLLDEVPLVSKVVSEEKKTFLPSVIFINPSSGCAVTGKVLGFSEKLLDFVPDFSNFTADILDETLIEDIFLCQSDEKIEKVSGRFKNDDDKIVLEICL